MSKKSKRSERSINLRARIETQATIARKPETWYPAFFKHNCRRCTVECFGWFGINLNDYLCSHCIKVMVPTFNFTIHSAFSE